MDSTIIFGITKSFGAEMQTTILPMFLTTARQAVAYVTFNPAKHYGTADRFVRVGQVVWC